MPVFVRFCSLAALFTLLLPGNATEPCRSGLTPGQRPGPYSFLVATGPERGQSHCYICETQDDPAVIVFARTESEPLGKLLKEIDRTLIAHKQASLKGWVTFLSDDQPALEPKLVQWSRELGLAQLPVGIFADDKGPPSYRINPDAELTVLLSVNRKVVVNFAFSPGELDNGKTAEIVKALDQILPEKAG